MVNELIITNAGDITILNKAFGDNTALPISKFKVGIDSATYTKASTDLTNPVPITDTEVDDCETADWASSADA